MAGLSLPRAVLSIQEARITVTVHFVRLLTMSTPSATVLPFRDYVPCG